ncbi:hypothetical protein KAF25_003001 [Fusarium avenaceum]|uniref:Membrane protein, peroxisomal n=1 Tax=Fusarium avenaceum TaxID=40199 RepID=A0A9P7H3C3_9HYPO|nr:hypothetical protein KAF25_003001 [Fusarium avenaceum]
MASLAKNSGKTGLEPKALLTAYVKQLQIKPLKTKMYTSGSLMALTEIIASWLAYGRDGHGPTFTSRVPQMAFYGAFVSAPLTHLLNGTLQKKFAGRTGAGNLLLQTLLTYIFIFPIQNTVYLASMALIAGARTVEQVRAAVRGGLVPMTTANCALYPVLLGFAKAFVPPQFWAPFFSMVGFFLGTYFNTLAKKRKVAAAAAAKAKEV